jgi:hypothetical protein
VALPITVKLPDGEWTCRWVNNFCYSKNLYGNGISTSCVVTYANPAGFLKDVYSPLESLYRTVTGTKLIVQNGVADSPVSNPAQRRTIYKVEVTEKSLFRIATPLYEHLSLTYEQHKQAIIDSPQFQELTSRLQLPRGFGYTAVHCLPNPDSTSPIQYFIVPSYEVLRYFFFQGNRLPHQLLSYFTGQADKKKHICLGIPELVAHPNGEPLIMLHKGERIAFLDIQEGLSDAEVSCLARIAFLSQAEECLERVRRDLLLNSVQPSELPEKWRIYKSLRTIFPQDQPFIIAACGREFNWQGKSYLLVDQLYDTQEEMPFDKISYNPLVDHRSKAITLNPTTQEQPRSSGKKTKPAASAHLTADEPGNANQPANITDFAETVSVFGVKPKVVKLPKKNQDKRYHTVGTTQEESELLSLREQGTSEAGPGRAQVDGDELKTVSDSDSKIRNFFSALRSLHKYTCAYLNLDGDPSSFQNTYHLNRARPGLPYGVVLGSLRPLDNSAQATIYIVWASTIRYALFYAPALQPLEPSILLQLYTDFFGKLGIVENLENEKVIHYQRFNPAESSVEELIKKIENKLGYFINNII